MKSFLSFYFLLATAFTCNKQTVTSNESQTTTPLTIDKNSCQQLKIANNNVSLCFEGVLEDSRCPVNVTCIWKGMAKATFLFTENEVKHNLTLSTITLPGKAIQDTVVAGYRIKLLDITPYPGEPAGTIKAKVEVTR